jgi:hypothetical protein
MKALNQLEEYQIENAQLIVGGFIVKEVDTF